MAYHNELGKLGEEYATRHLQQKGYAIIARNWTCGKHEIDIVAQDGAYIVFVEVKTRSSERWGLPEEAVSDSKIKRLVNAADCYISQNETDLLPRFDVVSVVRRGKSFEAEHFDDAFLPPVT